MKLEYRLLDEERGHPVLYEYPSIAREEIAARQWCDYFIKDSVVYAKESSLANAECTVIYVQVAEDEQAPPPPDRTGLRSAELAWELREYAEETADYPLIERFPVRTHMEVLLQIHNDALEHKGQVWRKTSCEIDEDRKVYVYYAIRE